MDSRSAYSDVWAEELIGGEIVAMSPAPTNHNRVSGNLRCIFGDYLQGKSCEAFGVSEFVYLTDEDVFLPDCTIVCDAKKVWEDGIHGAPDLVVEVLSLSTARYDRGRKMSVYAKCGVREYWIVDPRSKTVEQYLPDGDHFALHDVYSVHSDPVLPGSKPEKRLTPAAEFKCTLFDDLVIRLEDVFYRVD